MGAGLLLYCRNALGGSDKTSCARFAVVEFNNDCALRLEGGR